MVDDAYWKERVRDACRGKKYCIECGKPYEEADNGVTHHTGEDGYDLDADHSAYGEAVN